MEMNVKTKITAILLWASIVFAMPASAASLGIWPINPRIDANESATAIWIKNNDNQPLILQIRVMGWQQSNGEDNTFEQLNLIASPPMVKVNPGNQQMIRIVSRNGAIAESAQEISHRIFVDQVPDANAQSANDASLTLQMRYSLPLFSGVSHKGRNIPKHLKKHAAQLSFRISGNTQKYLEVSNETAVHIRLSRVTAIHSSGDSLLLSDGLLGYVLPGQLMRWEISEQQARFIEDGDTKIQFTQDQTEIHLAKVAS